MLESAISVGKLQSRPMLRDEKCLMVERWKNKFSDITCATSDANIKVRKLSYFDDGLRSKAASIVDSPVLT